MSAGGYVERPGVPFVVYLLAGAIIAAFVLTGQYNEVRLNGLLQYALIPALYDQSSPDHYTSLMQAATPLVSHVFLHGGVPHILMNMFAYSQAAPFLASRLGGARFLLLFFIAAIGGALAYILINFHSDQPAIGASGAICGIFGAYFLAVRPTPREAFADPQVRNAMLSFLGINVVLMALLHLPIAWECHLGGFIAGALAYLVLAPPRHRAGPWG